MDFDLRSHVNPHGGLVEKVHRNVARQPARQQDFLPIAAGKRRNRAFDERRAQRQFLDDPLHDAPLAAALQKLCGSRFGWPASKTLEVAQELYDGQGKKIITYPRAEVRYLPQSLISDVPRIVAGLRMGQSFSMIPVPEPPIIRKGASGAFYDKGLEGASHHAVIPNVNTIDKLREVWPRLSSDEKKLFDVNPSILLKLYIYGYLNRVQSSWRLEYEAGRNVEVMWLLCRLVPDHKTIADFIDRPRWRKRREGIGYAY